MGVLSPHPLSRGFGFAPRRSPPTSHLQRCSAEVPLAADLGKRRRGDVFPPREAAGRDGEEPDESLARKARKRLAACGRLATLEERGGCCRSSPAKVIAGSSLSAVCSRRSQTLDLCSTLLCSEVLVFFGEKYKPVHTSASKSV